MQMFVGVWLLFCGGFFCRFCLGCLGWKESVGVDEIFFWGGRWGELTEYGSMICGPIWTCLPAAGAWSLYLSLFLPLPFWSQNICSWPLCQSCHLSDCCDLFWHANLTKTNQTKVFCDILQSCWIKMTWWQIWQASKLSEKVMAVQPKSGEHKGAIKSKSNETAGLWQQQTSTA